MGYERSRKVKEKRKLIKRMRNIKGHMTHTMEL